MYDGPKILVGLAAFCALLTLPVWMSAASGRGGEMPALELPADQVESVESTDYMRASHMELLNRWRNVVVRHGTRQYRATDGEVHEMSLTGTCLGCHTDRRASCDRCHDYVDVEPTCWDCHVDPAGD